MYGTMLIFVLVVTGGAIAFIGDRLGTKIGKKKISLFGLRPRDTSTLMTVIAGVCITTLTFAVMAVMSENVRTALFGMEKLNRTMTETRAKLEAASGELESSQKELDRLHKQQGELERYARELAAGNDALEQAKEKLTAQNEELNQKNSGLVDLNGKLVKDNSSLQDRNELLREGLQIIREGEISFRAGEVVASGVIDGASGKEDVKNLMGMLVQIANRNAAQRIGVPEGKADVWLYQPEYEAAIEAIADSGQDVVVRIVAAGNLIRGEVVRANIELFKNHVVYRRGEYVFAQSYEVRKASKEEAQQLMMDFLQRLNQEATSKGILPDPIRGSVGVVEAAQFYNVVDELSGKSGKVMISAYANGDTDILGPLRISFRLSMEE